jgi:hypothetical protein
MNREDQRLVRETKALIKEVERGDTVHAAWIAIQDRVAQLKEGRTQAEVGELVGKKSSWIAYLLHWDSTTVESPFATAARPTESAASDRSHAKRALRDPENRRAVLRDLNPGELAQIAQDAERVAGRALEKQHTEEKHRARAVRQEHRPGSTSKVYELMLGNALDGIRDRGIDVGRRLAEAEGELTPKTIENLRVKAERASEVMIALVTALTPGSTPDAIPAEWMEEK